MDKYELTQGEGRTKVNLSAYNIGDDILVCIYNENAHIGAVAVGEYSEEEKRSSTSVITRQGHKDDVVAQEAAHLISKHIKKAAGVIAGIHIDNITKGEMDKVLENVSIMVADFIKAIQEQESQSSP